MALAPKARRIMVFARSYITFRDHQAKADYIVSRDPHLRNLKQFHAINIIDVKGFVEKLKGKD